MLYMETIRKWYTLLDVSSSNFRNGGRNENRMHFCSIDDQRLEWLENEFPQYLSSIKTNSILAEKEFLSAETYEALLITTASTVSCVRFLIENGFHFVLTRAFNSDSIELFFSGLRQTAGANDMLDCRSVTFIMNKIMKTGILSVPSTSNIETKVNTISVWRQASTYCIQQKSFTSDANELPDDIIHILDGFNNAAGRYYILNDTVDCRYTRKPYGTFITFVLQKRKKTTGVHFFYLFRPIIIIIST